MPLGLAAQALIRSPERRFPPGTVKLVKVHNFMVRALGRAAGPGMPVLRGSRPLTPCRVLADLW